jgi:hypothetical protein
MRGIWVGLAVVAAFGVGMLVSGGSDGFDMAEYEEIKQNPELSDAVHEWMHAYIEEYCRVSGRQISCE